MGSYSERIIAVASVPSNRFSVGSSRAFHGHFLKDIADKIGSSISAGGVQKCFPDYLGSR